MTIGEGRISSSETAYVSLANQINFKRLFGDFKFIHFSRPEGPNDVNSLITLRNLWVKLKIKLELFGVSRDFSDKDYLEFEIKDKSSVNDLRNAKSKWRFTFSSSILSISLNS